MTTRSRRGASKNKQKKSSAIAQLKQARSGGIDDLVKLDEEDADIYDTVSEEQYREIVRERRKREEFVVDDDGTGYYDDGEEHLFERAEGQDMLNFQAKNTSRDPNARKRQRALIKKRDTLAAAAAGTKSLGAMFRSVGGPKPANAVAKRRKIIPSNDVDGFDLDAELNSLETTIKSSSDPVPPQASNGRVSFAPSAVARTVGGGMFNVGLPKPSARVLGGQPSPSKPATRPQVGEDSVLVDIDEEADAHAATMVEAGRGNSEDHRATEPPTDANSAQAQQGSKTVEPKKEKPAEVSADLKALQDRKRRLAENIRKRNAARMAAETNAAEEAQAERMMTPMEHGQAKGGWFDMAAKSDAHSKSFAGSSSSLSSKRLPLLEGKDEDGDKFKFSRMYYIDAYADDFNAPGKVFLFGKVYSEEEKKYVSACVQVNGLQRQLFFLPKAVDGAEEPDMAALYKEINVLLKEKVIPRGLQGVNCMCKTVTRKYAFELDDIPRGKEGAQYMKCKYSAKFPALDPMTRGTHFSKIFGAKTRSIENFILKRKLMGPCWIDIRDPDAGNNCSYAMMEAVVEDPKMISVTKEKLDPPPLTLMSLSIKTYLNAKTNKNEVAVISAIIHKDVLCDKPTPKAMEDRSKIHNFSIIRGINAGGAGAGTFPPGFKASVQKQRHLNLTVLNHEVAMLNLLMTLIKKYDPDVLLGHNILGFDLDVIMHRMAQLNVKSWSKLGRLKLSRFPRAYQKGAAAGAKNFQRLSPGRLILDTYTTAKELVRESNYRLATLVKKYLKDEMETIDPLEVPLYYQTSNDLKYLQRHTENVAFNAMRVMFKMEMLPLTKQLTNLGGNLWARTLAGGRAERIEYLLLHQFHSLKYVVPDKERGKKPKSGGKKRGKPKYAGGLVLEPKKGLYDKFVLLLDFNSLYPSIIQEYNICFTTVIRDLRRVGDEEEGGEITIPELPDRAEHSEWGVLPTTIRTLIQRRSVVKKMLKKETDPEMKKTLDVRQKALKLTANSMYGCLGFSQSRFYAAPIAALVTSQGREILQRTVDLATGLGLDVIYGDTDSIMIYTGCDDLAKVKELGRKVKKEVNKHYKLLEIEIDGVFKSMLLLKKKKYAALIATEKKDGTIEIEKETKGLDMVRRDWCGLSKDVGHFVLDHVLSGNDRESVVSAIHQELQRIAKDVRDGNVALDKYVITKGLNKAPKDYADRKGMPHLVVATEMVKRGKPVNVGDHIPYVITAGESTSFADRARHPDDVVAALKEAEKTGAEPKLKIDVEWYLAQQVLPPTARLIDPIEGTSQAMIAENLGLDSRKYGLSYTGDLMDEDMIGFTPSSQMSDEERYKDSMPLVVFCPECQEKTSFPGVYRFPDVNSDDSVTSGLVCPTPGCHYEFNCGKIQNILIVQMRKHCKEYYSGWMRCNDGTCQNETRQQSCLGSACIAPGCRSTVHEKYPASELYTQLKYYELLFDEGSFQRKLEAFNLKRQAHNKPRFQMSLSALESNTFSALNKTVKGYLERSDYTWIKPTIWKNIFGSKRISSDRRF
jgi:DNA polymerase alpha subunit A